MLQKSDKYKSYSLIFEALKRLTEQDNIFLFFLRLHFFLPLALQAFRDVIFSIFSPVRQITFHHSWFSDEGMRHLGGFSHAGPCWHWNIQSSKITAEEDENCFLRLTSTCQGQSQSTDSNIKDEHLWYYVSIMYSVSIMKS